MVKVFTSRVNYAGQDQVNATVKSGEGMGSILTPTWGLVAGRKLYEAQQNGDEQEIQRWSVSKLDNQPNEPLDDAQYTDRYLSLLRNRYNENKQPFLDILNMPRATLTCYCGAGQFCHRHIAVDVLEKIAQSNQMPFERGGELNPYTGKVWVSADSPEYTKVTLGVLPIQDSPTTTIGYATAALMEHGDTRRVLELAHFGANGAGQADRYADWLCAKSDMERLSFEGHVDDVTTSAMPWLERQAQQNLIKPEWSILSTDQHREWTDNQFTLFYMPDELRVDPTWQEVSFGTAKIIDPNGVTAHGYAAVTAVWQPEAHSAAVLEVAHFANNGQDRAQDYTANLERGLQKRGFDLIGSSKAVEKTVNWLTQESERNRLKGEWDPCTEAELKQLDEGQGARTHDYSEVRTLSSNGPILQELER